MDDGRPTPLPGRVEQPPCEPRHRGEVRVLAAGDLAEVPIALGLVLAVRVVPMQRVWDLLEDREVPNPPGIPHDLHAPLGRRDLHGMRPAERSNHVSLIGNAIDGHGFGYLPSSNLSNTRTELSQMNSSVPSSPPSRGSPK